MLLALFAWAFLGGAHLWAGEEVAARTVGSVVAQAGRAKARQGRAARVLELGSAILHGDLVWTGSGSGTKLKIRFLDETEITIGRRARLTIDAFVYKAGDASSRCETSLDAGAFKVVGGLISKIAPDKTTIKTPACVIGIRGTEGVGVYSRSKTTMCFLSGKAISVANSAGRTLLTGASGMGCDAVSGRAPTPAVQFSPAQVAKLLAPVTFAGTSGAGGTPASGTVGNAAQEAADRHRAAGNRAAKPTPTIPTPTPTPTHRPPVHMH